ADAVEYASAHGSIVVASMGNDGLNKTEKPGCWNVGSKRLLRVTAALQNGMRARTCAYSHEYTEVAAPADDYLELGSTETSFTWSNPGTSCPAAFVATLAGKLSDNMLPDQVIATIIGTVELKPDLFDSTFSGGVVSFERALKAQ